MARLSDDDILDMIREGGEAEEKALRWMYKNFFLMVVHHITRNKGSKEEAEDIFQDALIAFCEHVKRASYRRHSSVSTFVMAIARNAWNNRLRRKGYGETYSQAMKAELDNDHEPASDVPDLSWMETEKEKAVERLFSELGEKCREILTLRFWDKLPMEKIALRMQYKNAQIAKNKHFRCLEELRDRISKDEALRNYLQELL